MILLVIVSAIGFMLLGGGWMILAIFNPGDEPESQL